MLCFCMKVHLDILWIATSNEYIADIDTNRNEHQER